MAKPNEWLDDLEDVELDSSPSSDLDDDDSDPKEDTSPDPDGGNQSGKGEPKGAKRSRGIEEVRGEFNRKLSKLEGMMQALLAQNSNGSSRTDSRKGDSLEDLSIEELQSLYAKAENAQQQAYLVNLMTTKRAREIVNAEISGYDQVATSRMRRQSAMRKAFGRFPELKDRNSSFHRAVMDQMNELGALANEPEALLHVANEVAFDLGIAPTTTRRRTSERGSNVAPGRTNRPVNTDGESIDEDRFNAVAHGLRHALGPMDEKKRERIKKRAKEYEKFRNDPNNPFVHG